MLINYLKSWLPLSGCSPVVEWTETTKFSRKKKGRAESIAPWDIELKDYFPFPLVSALDESSEDTSVVSGQIRGKHLGIASWLYKSDSVFIAILTAIISSNLLFSIPAPANWLILFSVSWSLCTLNYVNRGKLFKILTFKTFTDHQQS